MDSSPSHSLGSGVGGSGGGVSNRWRGGTAHLPDSPRVFLAGEVTPATPSTWSKVRRGEVFGVKVGERDSLAGAGWVGGWVSDLPGRTGGVGKVGGRGLVPGEVGVRPSLCR